MRTLLVTGAAGFIGSNFVRYVPSREPEVGILALDKLTYAGNLENLADLLDDYRMKFVKADICDAPTIRQLWQQYNIREVVHFAAESHVDRSILDSGPFIQTNVVGTQVLLDAARTLGVQRY